MKRIAVITMHAVKNYGSVLQTYATQRIIQIKGCDPVIIDFRRPWDTGITYYLDVKNKKMKDILKQIIYLPTKIKQNKIFGFFLKKYILLTEHTYHKKDDFKLYPCEADIYSTGSDQVWNSGWNRGIIEEFFLTFVSDEKKKVSYAASIGKSNLEENEKVRIAKYLASYDAISVRESSSISILNDIGIHNASMVLDPTLQLPQNEWRKIIQKDTRKIDNYVLIIQLNRNKKFDDFALEFARSHKKKLVRLCLRLDQAVLPGKPILIPQVVDYLSCIDNADYILTDSFHAVSFSLNFEKNFYCILPDKYSSRLESILTDLDLQDRIIKNYMLTNEQNSDIDYLKVNDQIEKMRLLSDEFLDNAFKA